MLKSAFLKDSLRQVKATITRFFSIMILIALGVAFLSGLKVSGPDMRLTASDYFDKHNFMDIVLRSTLGFNDDDISEVKGVKGIRSVMPAYSYDTLAVLPGRNLTVRLQSLSENGQSQINQPKLIVGRLPQSSGEILADTRILEFYNYKIGDRIRFMSGTSESISDALKTDIFQIVGFLESPEYITSERGSSRVGSGKAEAVFLLSAEDFNYSVYTELYLTIDNPRHISRFDNAFDNLLEPVTITLERIGKLRPSLRHDKVNNEAQQKISDAKEELKSGRQKLDNAQRKINNAEAKLADGWSEYTSNKWYVLDHDTNIGFVSISQDSKRLDALSNVIPLLFFLVAVLVTMTSMTRLVDSDRSYIGTLKAMGYSQSRIAMRYLLYAVSASVIGSIIGLAVGFNIIPRIVFNAYAVLYTLPSIITQFHWRYAVVSMGVAAACAALPAYFICIRSLREVPSELIRPAAPSTGKRTLMEKLPFIWNRFNFSQKVSIRNLFRYKKRFIMTVIGVAGCTALMFTGFGLRNAISTIVPKQYDKIQHYDLQIDLQQDAVAKEKQALTGFLDGNSAVSSYTHVLNESVDVISGTMQKNASLIVPDTTSEIAGFIGFKNRATQETLTLGGNGAIISEKLGALFHLKEGDSLSLRNGNGKEVKVMVSGVMENYLNNYIYMSSTLYRSAFGTEPEVNQVLCNLSDATGSGNISLSESLLKQPSVSSLTFTESMKSSAASMIQALGSVVIVLILSAAALVFVVIFSLTSINLEERSRELATLKVLGFFQKELAEYIYRENVVLTVLGTLLGLVLGVGIQRYIIFTMETDIMMFSRDLLWQSFVYSAGLTLVFALLVNLFMLRHIKKVDMVSSLKSIE